jgi:transposase InsO family protein
MGPIVGRCPNDRWYLDVVSDALACGRRIRVLAVLDTCTREALGIKVDTSLPALRVVGVLDQLMTDRGVPHMIVRDNGPELTSRLLDQWADQHGVKLQFIDPGKPIQNAFIESFNSRLRDAPRSSCRVTNRAWGGAGEWPARRDPCSPIAVPSCPAHRLRRRVGPL